MPAHLDALRHAARVCAAGYEPGTTERDLLERFAETGEHQRTHPPALVIALSPRQRLQPHAVGTG